MQSEMKPLQAAAFICVKIIQCNDFQLCF